MFYFGACLRRRKFWNTHKIAQFSDLEALSMAISHMHVARIQKLSSQIKMLDDKLMGNGKISMQEQTVIHTEIRRLKKEMEDLEKRTR
jgi:hypothetical protein